MMSVIKQAQIYFGCLPTKEIRDGLQPHLAITSLLVRLNILTHLVRTISKQLPLSWVTPLVELMDRLCQSILTS